MATLQGLKYRRGPACAHPALSLGNGSPVSILNSCFLLTQTQDISIKMVPAQPRKGETVTLAPGGNPVYDTCTWYRGQETGRQQIFTYNPSSSDQQNGPGFTGRETAGFGCSLSIRNLDVSDSGIYFVSKSLVGGTELGHVEITVSEPDDSSMPGGGSSKPSGEQDKSGLGVGTIVGIVTGGLATTVFVGGLVYYTAVSKRGRYTTTRSLGAAIGPGGINVFHTPTSFSR